MSASEANSQSSCWRAPDPKYLFQVINDDGSAATWHVYWDRLYAVRWRERLCLAASRFVPHNDFLFALYVAQKYGTAPVHHAAFPELPRSSGGDDPAKGAVELMVHDAAPLVPQDTLREAGRSLREAIDLVVAQQVAWLAPYLPQPGPAFTFSDVVAMSPFGLPSHAFPQAASVSGSALSGLTELDPRIVISFGLDRAIKDRLAEIAAEHAGHEDSPTALALRDGLEVELRKRLYSDPQYLTLVKWVMEARGTFVSPMVREFVGYYYERIKDRVQALSATGDLDPTFWEERLQSAVARAEADGLHARLYHLITLLGVVAQGDVPEEQPILHGGERVYRVAPTIDLGAIRLRPLSALAKRGLKVLVRTCLIHINIEDVRCLGENARAAD